MSIWLAASIALVCGLLPCALAMLRSDVQASLVALNVAGAATVLALVTLSVAFTRQAFVDLAVVLAALSIGGSLAWIRFLERRQ